MDGYDWLIGSMTCIGFSWISTLRNICQTDGVFILF